MKDRPPLSEQASPETPTDAARLLWETDQEKDAVTRYLRSLRRQMPPLLKAHRLAYARAYLGGEGPIEDRKRAAEEATVDEWFEVEMKQQEIEACKDTLRDLVGRAEDLRAINSNLKEELRNLGATYQP